MKRKSAFIWATHHKPTPEQVAEFEKNNINLEYLPENLQGKISNISVDNQEDVSELCDLVYSYCLQFQERSNVHLFQLAGSPDFFINFGLVANEYKTDFRKRKIHIFLHFAKTKCNREEVVNPDGTKTNKTVFVHTGWRTNIIF